jgi:hypothetical protein
MSRAVLKVDRRRVRIRIECYEEGCIFYAADGGHYCYLHRELMGPSLAEVIADYITNGRKPYLVHT